MAFMSLEVIFFRKKKQVLFIFASLFFVYLLPGFINEKSNNTLSVFRDGEIEHILRAKVWLFGLESVFWQN